MVGDWANSLSHRESVCALLSLRIARVGEAKMNPFDFVKSINETKQDLMVDELSEKSYAPFVVNRTLSYFFDTVFQANEMNRLPHLPKNVQYRFLLNTIRIKKRYAGKWHKQEPDADVAVVMEVYQYSQEKARDILRLLSPEDMKKLKVLIDTGGVVKTGKK